MATKDLSLGNPWKIIVLFALPMILSVTLQQVYNIADSVIAGRLIGGEALGGISASYAITMVFLGFATGSGVGTSVVVSRFFGMKKYKDVKTSIYTSLITFTALAVFLGILGAVLTKPMLIMLNTDSNILNDAITYLRFYCFGMVFLFLYNVVTYIFQALGNSKTPLFFLIFSTILNIGLDVAFSLIGMGVFGIALATFIAQGIASILSLLWLLWTLKKIQSEKPEIYSKTLIKTILVIAIPSMIQSSVVSIGGLIVQGEINKYGGVVTAGYGAAYKVCYIVINILFTMSNALSSYTSQNIGAKKMERIKPGLIASLVMSIGFGLIMTIIFLIFSNNLVELFLDKKNIDGSLDPDEIIKIGSGFLKVVTPFYGLIAIKICLDGVIKGAGDMRNFMIGTTVDLVLRVVFAFIFSYAFGYVGIWWSWPIGWVAAIILLVIFYLRGRWKKINQSVEQII